MIKTISHPMYFSLLGQAWARYTDAHPGTYPNGISVSEDVSDFMAQEQIYFLGTVCVDSELKPGSICLVHAPI